MISRRVKLFLIFTMSVTYFMWGGLAYLTSRSIVGLESFIGQLIFIAGGSAPTIGAYLAVAYSPDSGSLREFNGRIFKFRVGVSKWLFALLLPLMLWLLGKIIASIVTASPISFDLPQSKAIYILAFLNSILLGGLEEVGWRGVLQEELRKEISPFVANLAIGLIWGLWHLPLFYISGSSHGQASFIFFSLGAIGFSAFMTGLYEKTRSALICVIFHTAINAFAILGLSVEMSRELAYMVSMTAIFVAGLIYLGLARLREKL